jgi:hypothetical protein
MEPHLHLVPVVLQLQLLGRKQVKVESLLDLLLV